jgi:hypothetical protein
MQAFYDPMLRSRYRRDFAYAVSFQDQSALHDVINSLGTFGALRLPECCGINPFFIVPGHRLRQSQRAVT